MWLLRAGETGIPPLNDLVDSPGMQGIKEPLWYVATVAPTCIVQHMSALYYCEAARVLFSWHLRIAVFALAANSHCLKDPCRHPTSFFATDLVTDLGSVRYFHLGCQQYTVPVSTEVFATDIKIRC